VVEAFRLDTVRRGRMVRLE